MKLIISSITVLVFSITVAYAQDFDGIKKINGTNLYITIDGKGAPIVFIHGGPGLNHSYFEPHVDPLSKKFKTVLYDQRACGKSALPATDSLALSFFINDIEAIRNELKAEKITLFAHSWGSLLAVNYAMQFPKQVKSMILCNSVPLSKAYDSDALENRKMQLTVTDSTDRSIIMGSPDFKAGSANAYERLLKLSFRHSFDKSENISALNLALPKNYVEASQSLYKGLSKDLTDYDYYDEIKEFKFPVLILHGKSDLVPLEAIERMDTSIPNSELIVFNKSGHFIFIEEQKKFTSTVTKWLDK